MKKVLTIVQVSAGDLWRLVWGDSDFRAGYESVDLYTFAQAAKLAAIYAAFQDGC